MQSELKPCPFCGGEPHLMHCGAGTYMVQCLSCKTTTDDGSLDRISANWNRRSALVDVPAAIPTANCCVCGRIIDTREISQGGDNFGAETAPGKWTCSMECDDAVTGYVPDVPAVEPVAKRWLVEETLPSGAIKWEVVEHENHARKIAAMKIAAVLPVTGSEDVNHIAKAIFAERQRIIARLKEEANLTPCAEDAMVTRSNARLIEADFSYEAAERLLEIEEARENSPTDPSGISPIRQRGESDADQGN